jgi:hypothetical protein
VLGGGLALGVHHVALHDHPISEIDSVEDYFMIVRAVDDPCAVDLQQLPKSQFGKKTKRKERQG